MTSPHEKKEGREEIGRNWSYRQGEASQAAPRPVEKEKASLRTGYFKKLTPKRKKKKKKKKKKKNKHVVRRQVLRPARVKTNQERPPVNPKFLQKTEGRRWARKKRIRSKKRSATKLTGKFQRQKKDELDNGKKRATKMKGGFPYDNFGGVRL